MTAAEVKTAQSDPQSSFSVHASYLWCELTQYNETVDVLCSNLQGLGYMLRLLALQHSSWSVFTCFIAVRQT